MVNQLLAAFSYATIPLNRLLAWADFVVHYISGYLLYFLIGGYRPQYHTRPAKQRNGDAYTPSVLVTGASQGIGLATSIYLATKGYTVFASVKDEQELDKIKHEIKSRDVRLQSGSIHPLIMDVLSCDSVASVVEQVSQAIGNSQKSPLVGVVNNAGYCMISPMELTPDKAVRDLFELDFWAYITVIRAFLPLIKKSQGRFVNVCSYGAYVNPPMWVSYSAAKAAIEGMTRAWRFELLPLGVGMTSVRPGWTRSHGIGPKIASAWETCFNNSLSSAVGVDSMGDVVKTDKQFGENEKGVYKSMMKKWYHLTTAAADGAAQTSEAVSYSIYDALTDPFLQPYYTVGYDALLGQMVRDLTPESIYEVAMLKAFG
ncbi:D-beta-hydroxybutyrate dehydrogenase [Paramyrothecium foliicola]|nr:D-beta-hydroxybutyrate dehydrogenase [Paramyrothecium foliicola]